MYVNDPFLEILLILCTLIRFVTVFPTDSVIHSPLTVELEVEDSPCLTGALVAAEGLALLHLPHEIAALVVVPLAPSDVPGSCRNDCQVIKLRIIISQHVQNGCWHITS